MTGFVFKAISILSPDGISEPQDVLVTGREISHVDSIADAPAEARVIDGEGLTLVPGFIDAHVHIGFFEPRRVLEGGVTVARDLAWPPAEIFPLRDKLAHDPSAGPLLLVAGGMITAPGGYPTRAGWAPPATGLEVRSSDEARAAVRDMASRGADVIKMGQEPSAGPTLHVDVLSAIVEEAHIHDLRVTSHVGSLTELEKSLDAGVDELAHGLWSNEKIPASTIEQMVRQNVTVIPTLHIDPSRKRLDNLRSFVEAGGHVIYGTDMGNAGPPAGIDVRELELMMQAGMSSLEALASATWNTANYLSLERKGRIAPGIDADLVVVDGNPLEDLTLLASPRLVIREGVIVGDRTR